MRRESDFPVVETRGLAVGARQVVFLAVARVVVMVARFLDGCTGKRKCPVYALALRLVTQLE